MSRWIRFFIVLIVGFGIGVLYGWVINPVGYVDTYPEALREDYKTDYVLMVAEVYQVERDINLAINRLVFLGTSPPENLVERALYFGVENGYMASDLGLLRILSDALIADNMNEGENRP
jgi:hypothetical protein